MVSRLEKVGQQVDSIIKMMKKKGKFLNQPIYRWYKE